jgi:queuine tRNA-ribosyltransferase
MVRTIFLPENVMEIQRTIGADIIMAFDECTPILVITTMRSALWKWRTAGWIVASTLDTYPLNTGTSKLFFLLYKEVPIKIYAQSAEYIANSNQQGNAIGGLSVGNLQRKCNDWEVVCEILPEDKPRYLMGVGTPINLKT